MSESKHTPGPWEALHDPCRACDRDGRKEFVIIGPPGGNHGQFSHGPDARLIAAAPEMLEALERFMHYHQTMIDLGGQKEPFDKQMIRVLAEMQGEIVDKMKSAIKKARGSNV